MGEQQCRAENMNEIAQLIESNAYCRELFYFSKFYGVVDFIKWLKSANHHNANLTGATIFGVIAHRITRHTHTHTAVNQFHIVYVYLCAIDSEPIVKHDQTTQ